jgi:hypothetical protein
MMQGREILAHLVIKYNNNWMDVFKAIQEKEKVTPEEVDESIASLEGDFVCIVDKDYPEPFKNVSKPPFIIFLSEADRKRIGGDSEEDFEGYLTAKEIEDAGIDIRDYMKNKDEDDGDDEDEGPGGMDA